MKKIQLKSKDTNHDYNIDIEFVEPKDIADINNKFISYIYNSNESLNSYIFSYINNLSDLTYVLVDNLEQDYTYKFSLVDKKLYDMSINLKNTITYELETSYTDLVIINNVRDLEDRLSYAINKSNNIINTYNSDFNNKLGILTYYIASHINEAENIPDYKYWETYDS